MNKQEFLSQLADCLCLLDKNEVDKSVTYYDEIISDRMEDGLSEEDAIKALGDVKDIAQNIMCEMSIPSLVKAKINDSKHHASNKSLWIVLSVLGLPLWLPILFTFFALILSLYICAWAIIISLYALVVSLGIAGVAGIVMGIAFCIFKTLPVGLCVIGVSIICVALLLFTMKPVGLITKWLIKFTAFIMRKIKSLFIKRKENNDEIK